MNWTIYTNPHPQDPVPRRYRALMSGFFSKVLTYEEEQELDEWITASEENSRVFDQWLRMSAEDPQLRFIRKADIDWLVKKPVIPMPVLRAALWFSVLAGIGVWQYYTTLKPYDGGQAGDPTNNSYAGSKKTLSTGAGKMALIYLADSSSIRLEENSSLVYHLPYRGYRFTELKGAALFTVRNSKDKPQFHVYLQDDMSLNSRGGQFHVRVEPNGTVHLKAIEGRLRLLVGKESWALEAGQSAIFKNNTWTRYTN